MITPYNVLRHELVGMQACVFDAKHTGYASIAGIITSETRNTLTISQNGKNKTIPKDAAVFGLALDNGTQVRADGRLLLARPEDRVKKKIRITF